MGRRWGTDKPWPISLALDDARDLGPLARRQRNASAVMSQSAEGGAMSTREDSRIEHVVVLMLENRSYDHMLGYLPNGHGLAGDESNPVDPSDPASERVSVSDTSGYVTTIDPAHDFVGVEKELFGEAGRVVSPAPMNGFVATHIEMAGVTLRSARRSWSVSTRPRSRR
jgi:phospholipase C